MPSSGDLVGALRRWMSERSRVLIFIAVMAALTAFQAGLSPPRGFYGTEPNAGEPVLLVQSPDMYARFFQLKNMAMVTSLLLAVLLSRDRFYRTAPRMAMLVLIAVFDIFCLLSAFACY